jgi:hypothetical protein
MSTAEDSPPGAPTPETTAPPASLPSPPFITVEGIPNFRDLGHWPVSPAVRASPTGLPLRTRPSFIFRCAQPSQCTPAGAKTLNDLGITTFYDLRAGPELAKLAAVTPVNDIPGIKREFIPVYKDEDYSPEKLAVKYKMYIHKGGPEGFVRAYRDILSHGTNSYRTIFEHIRDRPNEGMVIHCTAGKDRTGVVCALILRLAGVKDEHIAEEYSLTEKGLGEWRFEIIKRLMADAKTDNDREGVENMVGSKAVNMIATLEMIDKEFGGEIGYLTDYLGFDDKDIETIRGNLVVEGKGGLDL